MRVESHADNFIDHHKFSFNNIGHIRCQSFRFLFLLFFCWAEFCFVHFVCHCVAWWSHISHVLLVLCFHGSVDATDIRCVTRHSIPFCIICMSWCALHCTSIQWLKIASVYRFTRNKHTCLYHPPPPPLSLSFHASLSYSSSIRWHFTIWSFFLLVPSEFRYNSVVVVVVVGPSFPQLVTFDFVFIYLLAWCCRWVTYWYDKPKGKNRHQNRRKRFLH